MNAAEIIEQELEKAEDRVRIAEEVLASAYTNARRTPSRENAIALKAATRLLKEDTARLEEWSC